MPDISMCRNQECTQRKECYRFMAVPSEYQQSYGTFKQPCDYFWPVKNANTPVRKEKANG